MIINELVSNSLKYAFADRGGQQLDGKAPAAKVIFVDFIEQGDDNCLLQVGDTGGGFPENIDIHESDTFGLKLVNLLVSQLDGQIEMVNDGGTVANIKLKKQFYTKRVARNGEQVHSHRRG